MANDTSDQSQETTVHLNFKLGDKVTVGAGKVPGIIEKMFHRGDETHAIVKYSSGLDRETDVRFLNRFASPTDPSIGRSSR